MLIGILVTSSREEKIHTSYGSAADMLERMLLDSSPAFTFSRYNVRDNVFPESVTICDGWLVTGSDHGVYEELPWMLRTEAFLREALAADVPVIGICFGHQLLAKSLGGKVVKSEKGWGIGLHNYTLSDGRTVTLPAFHQDQVVELPASAEVMGGSEFCPHAILRYGRNALTMQAHPEFSPDFLSALIEAELADRAEHSAVTHAARQSLLERTGDNAEVAAWIAEFLQSRAG